MSTQRSRCARRIPARPLAELRTCIDQNLGLHRAKLARCWRSSPTRRRALDARRGRARRRSPARARCSCACSRSACAAPTARSRTASSASPPATAARSCSATRPSRVVERDGEGFARGDLVTATVRRSCGHCLVVRRGRARLVPDGRLQRARDHAARRLRPRARRRGRVAARPRPSLARPARRARRADVDLRAGAAARARDRRP